MEIKSTPEFDEALASLNQHQREAATRLDGPTLVLAGPGTGKTQVLAIRIGYLLRETDATPEQILCLTYTDAAAHNMRERLVRFLGATGHAVSVQTFHGFCNQLIAENERYFGRRGLQAASDLERVDAIRAVIDSFDETHPLKRLTGDIYYDERNLRGLYANLKREDMRPETVAKGIDDYLASLPGREDFQYQKALKARGIEKGDPKENKISEETEKMQKLRVASQSLIGYQEALANLRRYDYEDMLLWVLEAFEKQPWLLQSLQERYQHVLVDEYQDTNGAQNNVLKALVEFWGKQADVFAVGDDDQAIYRFQGASMQNLATFQTHYGEALETVVLEQNYRSTAPILAAASALIARNEERLIRQMPGLEKNLIASGKVTEGPNPQVVRYPNLAHEEAAIAERLEALHAEGVPWEEMAVLYRNNRQATSLIALLRKRGVPLRVQKNINVLDHPLTLQLEELLKYLASEYKEPGSADERLFSLLHLPGFGVSPRDAMRVMRAWNELKPKTRRKKGGEQRTPTLREIIASPERMFHMGLENARAITALEDRLTYWTYLQSSKTPQLVFEHVVTEAGFLSVVLDQSDRLERLQVLTTLFDHLKVETTKNSRLGLGEWLDMFERMRRHELRLELKPLEQPGAGVHLFTVHSAKGREFEHVFVIGATEDQWEKRHVPSSFRFPDTLISATEDRTEEERRLFFVALTRAKVGLQISYAAQRGDGKEVTPSRFVDELLEDQTVDFSEQQARTDVLLEAQTFYLAPEAVTHVPLLDREAIERALSGFSLSVTALNKYLRCPLSFYFENVLRVPTARNAAMGFGSAVHQALNDYVLAWKEAPEEGLPSADFLMEKFEGAMDDYHSHFTDKEFEDRLTFGRQVLPPYLAARTPSWHPQVRTEIHFNASTYAGIPISGVLDKVEYHSDGAVVIDYKTGKPENARTKLLAPNEKEPLGGDYWRQLVFYKLLVDGDARAGNPRLHTGQIDFIQPEKSGSYKLSTVVITPQDEEVVGDQIREVWSGIQAQDFTGCGAEDCHWCNFARDQYDPATLPIGQAVGEEGGD